MPISSTVVGAELAASSRDVTVRDALAYAAGIGETGAASFDDSRAGGIVAPPSYCVSLEWAVVIGGNGRNRLGAEPAELRRGVHASQDSHFFRPIRPGDRLTTSGRYVGIRSTRSGTLLTTRLDTVDESERPVATSWSRSMFRGVEVAGGSAEVEAAPDVPRLPLDPDRVRREKIFVPREMPHVYTECARIWNPIHTERKVALAAGLPDIILHGTATWALAGREVLRAYGDADPARLKRLHGRFSAMVMPGSSVLVEHAPAGEARGGGRLIAFRVLNSAGEEALSRGVAVVT